ncbi:MAG: MBL fold metallo-hydrolase [Candidatus Micrarchaeota archaeon]
MELFFLGNGGGRIVLDRQMLPTGGFRVSAPGIAMHTDPGPGAFLKSFEHKLDPRDLNAIFCSHAHIDHCHDANILIEAMNFGNYNGRKGVLLGSKSVVSGYQEFEKQIDEYFKGMLYECKAMNPGDVHEFNLLGMAAKGKGALNSGLAPKPHFSNLEGGKASNSPALRAVKTLHEDPTDIGFVFESEGVSLGYTSDTGYFDGIAAQFEGCDFLIINCLRPNADLLEFHMTSMEVVKFVNEMVKKPRAIILTHLGMKFIQAGAEGQRKLVEEKSGVQAILAKEGLRLDLKKMKEQQVLV